MYLIDLEFESLEINLDWFWNFSISKLMPGSHQKCSHLWQAEVLIFVTSGHINHKICSCSQLSFVTIAHNSQIWSKFSLLITIFTIIKSHLSLVFICKICHKLFFSSKWIFDNSVEHLNPQRPDINLLKKYMEII